MNGGLLVLCCIFCMICEIASFSTNSKPQSSWKSQAPFSHTQIEAKKDSFSEVSDRRSLLTKATIASAAALTTSTVSPSAAEAMITKESNWPLWTALPVAPFNRRRTIKYEVGPGVFAFDQMIGIYYVHVPIRMSVVTVHQNDPEKRGLVVYAPVAPTKECLNLMQELIDEYGPVRDIILPSVAVEHKVNAGPFARAYPDANFYVCDKQYAFPLNLPNSFLGLPSWTKPLPRSSQGSDIWGGELEHEVLTVKPGIGSMFQDVALYHKQSETMLVCDAVFAVTDEPPKILTEEEEYTRALLFHAKDSKDEIVEDTPENRKKGWRRIVLLFDFFFPGSGRGDLGPGPALEALKTPFYKDGWGGWKPFSWGPDEARDFEVFSAGGKPTVLPIIQIILSRGPEEMRRWLKVVTSWNFKRVVPMHLDAPLAITPTEFEDAFLFLKNDYNKVRFCDEDVEFLRKAEEGPLNFSVYKTPLGTLRGEKCGIVRPKKNS
ncbi:hypothetical protein CTEN210_02292 [Chaetoceros tenuissimus]|uniref:DUF4336 domain-containing protein n=1 Tax=Chaetoceros tenuissimus TaxID=426638 RepID=A0AAD3CHA6_9STRA|nr:hypothetical protein CTEN210_02292 [Chaetoceros tenuissimus]